MCVQHDLLWVPTESQLLVLLHCAKVEIDGRRYDNWNTFSSLGQKGKENNLFLK